MNRHKINARRLILKKRKSLQNEVVLLSVVVCYGNQSLKVKSNFIKIEN